MLWNDVMARTLEFNAAPHWDGGMRCRAFLGSEAHGGWTHVRLIAPPRQPPSQPASLITDRIRTGDSGRYTLHRARVRSSLRMPRTAYRMQVAHCLVDCWNISSCSIGKLMSWSDKSTPGTVRAAPASDRERFRESGHSRQVRQWRVSRRCEALPQRSPIHCMARPRVAPKLLRR